MRGLSLALTIASAAAIAAPASARAGGAGVVAVAPRDQRPGVEAAMAAAIEGGRGTRVVKDALGEARAAGIAGAAPLEAMARFRHVREQIDEGWRAYHSVQLEFAISRLAAARTSAEAALALPGMTALYADASLRLGAVLAQLGRSAEARDAISLALALDPDRPITQLEFSPEVVAAVDAVRAQPRAGRPVRITSEPPGAVLSVDGRDAGRTPLTADLATGQHVLIARAPQFHPYAQAFALDDRRSELPLVLEHDEPAAELAGGIEPGLAEAVVQTIVDRVLELADLDEVVLVAATERRGGPTLLLQRCAGAPARCTAVVELGYADRSGVAAAARTAWQSVRAADLRYPPSVFGDPRLVGTPGESHCRVCRSPILWAGVGVAAVVATIAIVAVATSSRPTPILTADPGSFTTHP
jgi:hypothetical protein